MVNKLRSAYQFFRLLCYNLRNNPLIDEQSKLVCKQDRELALLIQWAESQEQIQNGHKIDLCYHSKMHFAQR